MTMSLFHVLHYGFRKKMLLVNTPTGQISTSFRIYHRHIFLFLSFCSTRSSEISIGRNPITK